MSAAKAKNAQPAKAAAPPLANKTSRAWLAAELAKADEAVQHGPDGQGWRYNEAKRAEVTALAAFLRALTALLD
jgi:hypothetical protein